MPEGVPPAAVRPEPVLPAPGSWPFGEHFPRTCGTGRLAEGAIFWTDWLYDDHGAAGIPWDLPAAGLSPPHGTFTYPEGPANGNGADIFRVAVGLTETDSWWRVDWNTLVDASVPVALFAIDSSPERPSRSDWPAGAAIRSEGIDYALLVSGAGAWLLDLETDRRERVYSEVDMDSRSFLARLPRTLAEPTGSWTIRLAAGLANETGDGFAAVGEGLGALPGQPPVYNLGFRTNAQEPQSFNFWSDKAQAAALADGDVSQFSLPVPWEDLAKKRATPEPLVLGPSTCWYVSSVELGQGVAETGYLSSEPRFLGRVQPYSICLPATYQPGQQLPLTLLLHSLEMGQNQFAAIDPRLLHRVCDGRGSVVVTPLARGPGSWYFDEGELDVWEVWARVAGRFSTDPNRTVIAGYSMGGYAAYKLGLTYPAVFAQAVALAGPPTCGVRLLPDIDIPGNLKEGSHCAEEGDTWRLLPNARWLPFVIEHGALDELVPVQSVAFQVLELDHLGYRYRFVVYSLESHVDFALQDKFDDAVAHMGTGLRQADPGHITLNWYPRLVRSDLGIGPHQAWWLSELTATEQATQTPGALARVDARSYARPDPSRRTERTGGLVLHFDMAPGAALEQKWVTGPPPIRHPVVTLQTQSVATVTIDLLRAGFHLGEQGSVGVVTDCSLTITLTGLSPALSITLDGTPTGSVAAVPPGRHQIRFA